MALKQVVDTTKNTYLTKRFEDDEDNQYGDVAAKSLVAWYRFTSSAPTNLSTNKLINVNAAYGAGANAPALSTEKIGDYPLPIVDERTGRSSAMQKIYDVRKGASHRARSTHVLKQHGSRRLAKKRSPKKSKKDPISGSLF